MPDNNNEQECLDHLKSAHNQYNYEVLPHPEDQVFVASFIEHFYNGLLYAKYKDKFCNKYSVLIKELNEYLKLLQPITQARIARNDLFGQEISMKCAFIGRLMQDQFQENSSTFSPSTIKLKEVDYRMEMVIADFHYLHTKDFGTNSPQHWKKPIDRFVTNFYNVLAYALKDDNDISFFTKQQTKIIEYHKYIKDKIESTFNDGWSMAAYRIDKPTEEYFRKFLCRINTLISSLQSKYECTQSLQMQMKALCLLRAEPNSSFNIILPNLCSGIAQYIPKPRPKL